MTDHSDYLEDNLALPPETEVVHWMDRRPMSVGAAGLSSAVATAFLLGAVAALGLVALSGHLTPRTRVSRLLPRSFH